MGREVDLPAVSVVVLNCNGKGYLEECFRSLEALDYPSDKLEVMMVDNGSTDGSVDYVRAAFPRVLLLQNKRNLGFAKANNQGAERAKGEYVAFVNNDARADTNWLKELVKTMLEDGEIACVGGKILDFKGRLIDFGGGACNFYGMGRQAGHRSADIDKYSQERETLFVCGGSMLVKREIFLACRGFDEDYFAYFEDVDLGWRLWLLGYKVVFAPKAITYHRGLGTSKHFATAKRSALLERNALYTIIKNYDEENLLRILPAALLLTVRRAVIFSHIGKDSYRMDMMEDPSMIWPASAEPRGLARTKLLGRDLRTALREYGLWIVSKELVRRALRWGYARSVLRTKRDLDLIPRVGVSHLVAMDDVIEMLATLMEKRRWLQARRKRPDSEILRLFETPFFPHPPYPEYERLQHDLSEYLGIYEIFKKSGYEDPHH